MKHRPAVAADAAALAPRLRKEDLEEALLYRCPGGVVGGLEQSIESSYLAMATEDQEGAVQALWGLCEDVLGVHPWLMCSDAVMDSPRDIFRLSRGALEQAVATGKPVNNFIGKASHANRRFVRALGFELKDLDHPVFDLFYLP